MLFFPWTLKNQYYTYWNILRLIGGMACFTSGIYCIFQGIKSNICACVFYKICRDVYFRPVFFTFFLVIRSPLFIHFIIIKTYKCLQHLSFQLRCPILYQPFTANNTLFPIFINFKFFWI